MGFLWVLQYPLMSRQTDYLNKCVMDWRSIQGVSLMHTFFWDKIWIYSDPEQD